MSNHTKGPWQARNMRGESYGEVRDSRGLWVARVHLRDGIGVLDGEAVANTTLIAAAPELLAACRLLLDSERSLGDLCASGCRPGVNQHTQGCAVALASAAIAKADGRS